jgi:hypothetical protein
MADVHLQKPSAVSVSAAGIVDAGLEFAPSSVDQDWLEIFRNAPFPTDLDEPEISTRTVHIRVAKPELARYMEALKERVEATNREFTEKVLPRREIAEEEEAATQAAREREEDEVRQIIEDSL